MTTGRHGPGTWTASGQAAGPEANINYYGFSYGTYLGQVYSTLFPSHVRRLIMDSKRRPAPKVWYQANLDQDVAFKPEHQESGSAGWPQHHAVLPHLGRTEKAVEKPVSTRRRPGCFKPPYPGVRSARTSGIDVFLEARVFTSRTWLQWGSAFSRTGPNTHSKKAAAHAGQPLYQAG